MKTDYYVFIHRPGPKWLTGKPVTEQPLEGHFRYMSQLEQTATLVVGGGFTDGAGAMGVLRASSLSQARDVAQRDPAVEAEIVVTEVHPWFVTVGGEIAKN